ncbi:MAG TPA: DnaA regulatory inactivator Hda [Ideonella sp.]|uniref:DnaA regulatory inactivator Hda n=1 Tax=Ideonella sp. TaxID=1929293 RepID=UPI002B626BC2|nr:DnaA regulatory inactivator Hda [Ideonella sp.]HSI46915.1 DnaA regulatory inactivator Hda [Ideonella sp.]
MKQMPLAIGLEAEPDFHNFVPGDNSLAAQAMRDLVLPGPPVYLCGPAGSGKTHLLSALAHQVHAQGGRSGWFDADHALPWTFDEGWSLILIDGAERLDPARQHAAFTLFVEAATHGVQMASAGRLPPVDLPVREDLRTRFGWGHVFALHPLGDDGVREVLVREARHRGLALSSEVLDYLLSHFSRELGSLMALLIRLDRFSLAEGRALSVPLLKKMLAEEPGQPTLPAANAAQPDPDIASLDLFPDETRAF